jgi:hypothetical protein
MTVLKSIHEMTCTIPSRSQPYLTAFRGGTPESALKSAQCARPWEGDLLPPKASHRKMFHTGSQTYSKETWLWGPTHYISALHCFMWAVRICNRVTGHISKQLTAFTIQYLPLSEQSRDIGTAFCNSLNLGAAME